MERKKARGKKQGEEQPLTRRMDLWLLGVFIISYRPLALSFRCLALRLVLAALILDSADFSAT